MSNTVPNEPVFDQEDRPSRFTTFKQTVSANSGVFLLLLSQVFNSLMVTTCKLLETDENFDKPIHPLQILFVRMSITYVCCLLYMAITRSVKDAPWGPKEVRHLLVLRGLTGFVGVFGMYYSLQYLSLSDAVAITFLIPMVTAFLAWVLLKESYSVVEGVCSLVSLAGVLLIAKPHFLFGKESDAESGGNEAAESSLTELRLLASGVGLVGVAGASSIYIILRKIGTKAHPLISVTYFALITCIISFLALLVIPSLSIVLPENKYQWSLFFLIGFSGFFMQFSLAAGVQKVKASKSALMIYVGMIFAVVWDLIIWHHLPGLLSILGILLIAGNAYIIMRFKQDPQLSSDIENQYEPVSEDNISLQEFTITDSDSESDNHKSAD